MCTHMYITHAGFLIVKNAAKWDFPGSPVVKNLPCNGGYTGSILGWRNKTTHATEQLRLHAPLEKLIHCNEELECCN